MNDFNNLHRHMTALESVRFAVRKIVSGAVLPSNNGPIFTADTRNPLYASGLIRIQGCH